MDLSITLLTASSHCVVTFVMPLSISSPDNALAGPAGGLGGGRAVVVDVVDDADDLLPLGALVVVAVAV
jgi:hypothetical protein